jgi:hypothetical protein
MFVSTCLKKSLPFEILTCMDVDELLTDFHGTIITKTKKHKNQNVHGIYLLSIFYSP